MVHQSDAPTDYELLDVGDGRQLARFGTLVADRPCPAAVDPVADAPAWANADLRYERPSFGGMGQWVTAAQELPEAWTMTHAGLTFELRPSPSGQVGFFGEQVEPWGWVAASVRELVAARAAAGASTGAMATSPEAPATPEALATPGAPATPEAAPATGGAVLATAAPPAVLNLFAYTGGSTLVAAANGAAVTHVDSSRPAVAWARRNADLSGLSAAPVRWIVDDALAFVAREARRGRRYNGLILDPPSYGHGPGGEPWTLTDHLPVLLDACLAIATRPGFVMLTAHAEGLRPADLAGALAGAFDRAGRGADAGSIEAGGLQLRARSGASAPAGAYARWRG